MNAEQNIIHRSAIEDENIKNKILEFFQKEISEGNESIILTAGCIANRKGFDDIRDLGDDDFYADNSDPYILNISLRIESWDNSFEAMKEMEEIQARINQEEKRKLNELFIKKKKLEIAELQKAIAAAEKNMK